MAALKITNLTKNYGTARGVNNISLEVGEKEFFGFIGPNGAGKSTTIRTLLGLIKANSGEASILGMSVATEKEKILARIGYLPSEAVFYSGMRVKDILRLSAELHKKDCSEECARLCERLQLDTGKKVEELSFGNRKKVGIVCALQHMPELIILDEPTSGLDPLMQKEFFDILKERNEAGATIFMSSHILSEIQKNCTRAAIIREGRIIACDSVENLSKTNTKRINVVGSINTVGLPGVKDLQITENGAGFLFNGEIRELLRVLSEGNVTDLSVAEPDLEEVFIHYYEQEVEA